MTNPQSTDRHKHRLLSKRMAELEDQVKYNDTKIRSKLDYLLKKIHKLEEECSNITVEERDHLRQNE